MGQLGDLFPGAQLRKDTPEDAGNAQKFDPGPFDLDSGVIRLAPTPKPARDDEDEQPAQ